MGKGWWLQFLCFWVGPDVQDPVLREIVGEERGGGEEYCLQTPYCLEAAGDKCEGKHKSSVLFRLLSVKENMGAYFPFLFPLFSLFFLTSRN